MTDDEFMLRLIDSFKEEGDEPVANLRKLRALVRRFRQSILDPEPHIDVVFDGPPSQEGGQFIEVEDHNGQGIKVGEWIKRDDGYWVLRMKRSSLDQFI